jgi:hypothetical protein
MNGGKVVRLPDELIEELDMLPAIEDRSWTGIVRVALRDGLALRSQAVIDEERERDED